MYQNTDKVLCIFVVLILASIYASAIGALEKVDVSEFNDKGNILEFNFKNSEQITKTLCNHNKRCDNNETCASCPNDCNVCSVKEFSSQIKKYVDKTCQYSGNGLVDSCASAGGGAGRFNELQSALDSLEAGDTLHVYPGDYWRDHMPIEGPHGVYTVLEKSGTKQRPIIVTAADVKNPPVIHSCNPENPTFCQGPAIAAAYSNHVTLDNLKIRGLAQIRWGNNNTMQYLDVSYGWGPCADGNWAGLRIEGGDGNAARFNYVHDISGAGSREACEAFPYERNVMSDRGSGLKEFSATNTIWEFNTVVGAPYWGYDLHRNSTNSTIRFNRFEQNGKIAIRSERGQNVNVYGNIIIGTGRYEEDSCIEIRGRNEQSHGSHHNNIFNNTCLFYTWGIRIDGGASSNIVNNIVSDLTGSPTKNIIAPGQGHYINNNAWDSSATFHKHPYDGPKWIRLTTWQRDTGYDLDSVAAPGGACEFINPPSQIRKGNYNLKVKGLCKDFDKTMNQEIGIYGIIDCVGHKCGQKD